MEPVQYQNENYSGKFKNPKFKISQENLKNPKTKISQEKFKNSKTKICQENFNNPKTKNTWKNFQNKKISPLTLKQKLVRKISKIPK